jgi:hypothetical protein
MAQGRVATTERGRSDAGLIAPRSQWDRRTGTSNAFFCQVDVGGGGLITIP